MEAEAGPEAAAAFFGIGLGVAALGCVCFMLTVGLAIKAYLCYLLSGCLQRIPPQYRQQDPSFVWLLMIPLASLVLNFFVYPALAKSYQAYFQDRGGGGNVGDCGAGIALAFCICAAASITPYAGVLTAIAALVLLIMFMIKALELKKLIPEPPVVAELGGEATGG